MRFWVASISLSEIVIIFAIFKLYAMVDERDAKIKALEEKLAQAQSDYDSLKMAKMMTISDNDMEATQKRIAKLIRDVNKCITLLGEK